MILARTTFLHAPLLSIALSLLVPVSGAGDDEGALLVVNPANPESMYVANYYRAARDIPDTNFLHIDPDAPDFQTFAAVNVPALLGEIRNKRIDDQIDYVIVMPGGNFYLSAVGLLSDNCHVPRRISISSGYTLCHVSNAILSGMSTSSANRFYASSDQAAPFDGSVSYYQGSPSGDNRAHRYFIGALLGYTGTRGNTLTEILDMIDRSVAVDGTDPAGTFYFMQTADNSRSGPRHNAYPPVTAAIVAEGGQAQHLYDNLPLGHFDCAGIMTGLANPNIDGGNFNLLPGSFADHLTSHAATFNISTQTKISRWIAKGASGSSGAVEEPCSNPGKFPRPKMHLLNYKGMSLGEAWLRKMVFMPFQSLLLGDPLTTPYSEFPIVNVPDPPLFPVGGVATIMPTAFAAAPGAQIAELELLVDGVHDQRIAPGAEFALDTRGYGDGWHELRVLAVDNTNSRNAGRWIGELEVDNHGLTTNLVVSPTSGNLATAYDFTYAAAGGTVSEVRLLHNGRIVAASQAPSGTLRLYGQNLGAGPVRIRAEALYASGRIAYSPWVNLAIDYAPGVPLAAPPVAFAFEKRGLSEQAFVVELPAAYDEDPAGLTWTVVQPPAHATLLSSGSGPYRVYKPTAGANGIDSLTFRVTGTGGVSQIKTVTLVYDVLPTAEVFGCGVNPNGSILLLDGVPALGDTLTLGLDNPLGTQTPGSLGYLFFSLAPTVNYPCGILVDNFGMAGPGTQGELLINTISPDPTVTLIGGPWVGTGTPVEFVVPVPSDPVFAGVQIYGQGLIHDSSGLSGVPIFGMTEGVVLTIG